MFVCVCGCIHMGVGVHHKTSKFEECFFLHRIMCLRCGVYEELVCIKKEKCVCVCVCGWVNVCIYGCERVV